MRFYFQRSWVLLCNFSFHLKVLDIILNSIFFFTLQLRAEEKKKDRLLGTDSNFQCPGDGNWPHPSQCRLFYNCRGNHSTLKRAHLWQCRDDFLYDTKYHRCRYSKVTNCGDRIKSSKIFFQNGTYSVRSRRYS